MLLTIALLIMNVLWIMYFAIGRFSKLCICTFVMEVFWPLNCNYKEKAFALPPLFLLINSSNTFLRSPSFFTLLYKLRSSLKTHRSLSVSYVIHRASLR